MQTVSLDEAKTNLGGLIEAAAAGEEVFIAKDEAIGAACPACGQKAQVSVRQR